MLRVELGPLGVLSPTPFPGLGIHAQCSADWRGFEPLTFGSPSELVGSRIKARRSSILSYQSTLSQPPLVGGEGVEPSPCRSAPSTMETCQAGWVGFEPTTSSSLRRMLNSEALYRFLSYQPNWCIARDSNSSLLTGNQPC